MQGLPPSANPSAPPASDVSGELEHLRFMERMRALRELEEMRARSNSGSSTPAAPAPISIQVHNNSVNTNTTAAAAATTTTTSGGNSTPTGAANPTLVPFDDIAMAPRLRETLRSGAPWTNDQAARQPSEFWRRSTLYFVSVLPGNHGAPARMFKCDKETVGTLGHVNHTGTLAMFTPIPEQGGGDLTFVIQLAGIRGWYCGSATGILRRKTCTKGRESLKSLFEHQARDHHVCGACKKRFQGPAGNHYKACLHMCHRCADRGDMRTFDDPAVRRAHKKSAHNVHYLWGWWGELTKR